MNIAKKFFVFGVCALVAGAAQAATVSYTLYQDSNALGVYTPGSFRVTAKVTGGDNGGLSGFGIDLNGTIATLDNNSPRDPSATTATQEGPTGFTLGRSADNVNFIVGSQDIGNADAIMVYGLGQQAGGFVEKGITVGGSTLEQPIWGAELMLAVGTYTGVAPTFNQTGPNAGANVFVAGTGTAVRGPESVTYTVVPGVVPEPATLALAGMAIVGLTAVSRRRNA